MRNSIYRINLDIHNILTQVQIIAKKGDSNRRLCVTMMEHGKPYVFDIPNARAVIRITKPGAAEDILADCDIYRDGTIIYDFTDLTVDTSGEIEARIELYVDDAILTTPKFAIVVLNSAYDTSQVLTPSMQAAVEDAAAEAADAYVEETIQPYVDAALANKADKLNPAMTGSMSLNRIGTAGDYSVAVGNGVMASGDGAFAEGAGTKATETAAHAEGLYSESKGIGTHAEGVGTVANGYGQHVEGAYNVADTNGVYAHIVGNGSATGHSERRSNAHTLDWDGNAWFKGDVKVGGDGYDDEDAVSVATTGDLTSAMAQKANAANPVFTGAVSLYRKENSLAVGTGSTAMGYDVEARNSYSHAEGQSTLAAGTAAHAEGYESQAKATAAHAEGSSIAEGNRSHSEGTSSAGGAYSHAEGQGSSAAATASHAEGYYSSTSADAHGSHAEGKSTASESYAHAEGYNTEASGVKSHVEGEGSIASGYASHAEGYKTVAASPHQHVQGKLNVADSGGAYAHILGNGKEVDDVVTRSNAHTIDWNGNAWFAGNVKVGGTSYDDPNAVALVAADRYEPVVEIDVGTMDPDGSVYMWYTETSDVPTLSDAETYYLNGEENPSSRVLVDDGMAAIAFNATFTLTPSLQITPIDATKPYCLVGWLNGLEIVASGDQSLSGETVRILKRLSLAGGVELNDTVTGTRYRITIANGQLSLTALT